MYVSRFGCLEIIKLLIENGVNINEKDDNNKTALFYATKYGQVEIVKLLIENGANINEKDNDG